MHIITSFGLVFLVKYFDNWGVLFILIPVSIGFMWGILYCEKLDKVVESYPQTSLVTVPADNL